MHFLTAHLSEDKAWTHGQSNVQCRQGKDFWSFESLNKRNESIDKKSTLLPFLIQWIKERILIVDMPCFAFRELNIIGQAVAISWQKQLCFENHCSQLCLKGFWKKVCWWKLLLKINIQWAMTILQSEWGQWFSVTNFSHEKTFENTGALTTLEKHCGFSSSQRNFSFFFRTSFHRCGC